MKRQLIVEVDCGETTCAPCGWQGGEIGVTGNVRSCQRFGLAEIVRCKDGASLPTDLLCD